MKQSTWWTRVVVVLTLSVISTSPLIGQQPYRPSISIGGFNVFIGMSLDSLMKTVGSVFARKFTEPSRWDFLDNEGIPIANVFIHDQRVFQIVKHFRGNSFAAAQQVYALKQAIADFEQLTSAQPGSLNYVCIFINGEPHVEPDISVSFFTRCGYYGLEKEIWVGRSGTLGIMVRIRVWPAEP